MGNDEHGPAYPEPPYRCPICNGDKNRFFTCEYPGCPDGRDRGHPYARLQETYEPAYLSKPTSAGTARMLAGWACFLALLLYLMWPHTAHGMNHGFNPDSPTAKWFESKIRPDSPPNSCCGKGDAYPVERYELHPELHEVWVWVSDGSAMKYPDGTTRDYWDMSTKIVVPDTKVNPPDDDLDNPTDVSWIFMRVSTPTDVGTIYCFIPHPSGN